MDVLEWDGGSVLQLSIRPLEQSEQSALGLLGHSLVSVLQDREGCFKLVHGKTENTVPGSAGAK